MGFKVENQKAKFIVFCIICTLLISYFSVLTLFMREGHPSMVLRDVDQRAVPIHVDFISVDIPHESIMLTILPDLSSPTLATQGKLLADLEIAVDTGVTVFKHTFRHNDKLIPWEVSVPIEYGDPLEYPFDAHRGDFHIEVKKTAELAEAPQLSLNKIQHGFQISAVGENTPEKTALNVEFEIRRSKAVILVSLFAMTSLTLVVLSALNVAWHVVIRGRAVEFSMMTWLAALLFVIPAVRAGLPGSPPHGALIDIALFFWLNILAVLALLSVVWKWSKGS
jgi:hypothetical protein